TKDIIVFYNIDLGGGDYDQIYGNSERFGTRGIEMTYTFRKNKWMFETNYSFYQAGTSTVDRYAIAHNDKAFVAFPQHKIIVNGGYDFTKNLSLNVIVNHFSERWAY